MAKLSELCQYAKYASPKETGLRDMAVVCRNPEREDNRYPFFKLCVASSTYSTGHSSDDCQVDLEKIAECVIRER